MAVPFLRRHIKVLLGPDYTLQKTPYDHVLRREERKQKEFANQVGYIRENPYRAGLVEEASDPWLYECCVIPGYPELELNQEDFWGRFWRVYFYLVEKNGG